MVNLKNYSGNKLLVIAVLTFAGSKALALLVPYVNSSVLRLPLFVIAGALGVVSLCSLALGIIRKLRVNPKNPKFSGSAKTSGKPEESEVFKPALCGNHRYLAVILVALLFLTAFYWFQIKPSQAKKYCSRTAETQARLDYDYTQSDFRLEDYAKHYAVCMAQRGYGGVISN
jgi:hypothetical protein